jgi:serine/threonine-protein kinase
MLIYPWVEGELLGKPLGTGRGRPILERFRELPPGEILNALGIIFEVHTGLAAAGWMAVDFYDGCLIYDFDAQRLGLIDLDCYHPGPFTNEMGRMFGSSRFMAPEEFERGARIDEQTTVFTMGRTAFVLLANGSTDPEDFRGGGRIFEVVRRACRDERGERQASMAEFYSAWSNAKA